MSWKCPACGRQNYGTFKNCICSHYDDGSILVEQGLIDNASIEGEQFLEIAPNGGNYMPLSQGEREGSNVKAPEKPDSKSNMPLEEVIKEIDAWRFAFSHVDHCICIGTPALQSFRLKLAAEDLEELLEFLYQKTGKEKTTRKLRLSTEEIIYVVDKVNRMIEEKRSKAALKFVTDELQEIADLINVKLKV